MIELLVHNTIGQEAIDLDAVETSLRMAVHKVGCVALEGVLKAVAHQSTVRAEPCAFGHIAHKAGTRSKQLMTMLGPVVIDRQYYHDSICGSGQCPIDRVLDIEGTMFSPGLRNMMAFVGATNCFKEGAEELQRLAGLTITAKSIERLCGLIGPQVEAYRRQQVPGSDVRLRAEVVPFQTMYVLADGTGIPVLKRETAGRKGKGKDGIAKTREMKLGCVFTQTHINEFGYPVRDETSTSYIGACETASVFGVRLEHEAQVRGIDNVRRLCVIGDGAAWIWNLAADRFPTAIKIVDLYHAREHYNDVAKMVFPIESSALAKWTEQRKQELDNGDVPAVIRALEHLKPRTKAIRKARDNAIGYFNNNADRMRYAEYRAKGLFVGSGVIEAGCKTVVGKRLKQSGMHWTVRSAGNVLALRCLLLGQRWDDFWESRVAA